MTFLDYHAQKDDPFARVLFYSLILHYLLFFIFFGNPFLLSFDEGLEDYGMQKAFNIELLPFSGLDGQPLPNQRALGLFPPEVGSKGERALAGKGLNPEALHDSPSEINEAPKVPDIAALNPLAAVNALGQGRAFRLGAVQYEGKASSIEEALPLVTSKKLPPNMTGLEDCMIKVVGMVCPNGDAKCIAEYKDFCATLPQ